MARYLNPMPERIWQSGSFTGDLIDPQNSLLPVLLTTREFPPQGAHISHVSRGDDGALYYCKSDQSHKSCRMREALYSQLAMAVGLPTPDFRIVEDQASGESFFGSKRHPSTASDDNRKRFLRTESKDELGRFKGFPGRWLSQLHAFDLFVHNDDRSADNIVVHTEGRYHRLCPIDFTSSGLGNCVVDQFPIDSSETNQVAKLFWMLHGFFPDSALQMVANLEAVPIDVFNGFFKTMPQEWIDLGEKETLCDFWAGQAIRLRLDALRESIRNAQVV